jgi:tetratricopeptide (TPR) repeat protein
MTEKRLRFIFYFLAFVMLVSMLLISRDAGISGDEEVHYKQSELVYNYFTTLGQDKSALNTPKTHLQYYGQSFDNIVTVLIHWFDIEDIYSFRHLMCSFSGWLTILVTSIFAASFAGYGAAILVLFLFAVSPAFLGHAQNNLKDIPFALAYISSVYFSLKLVFAENKTSKTTLLFLILSIGLALGIRAGGILVIFNFAIFIFIKTLYNWLILKNFDAHLLKKNLIQLTAVSVSGFIVGLLLWPYALQNPILNTWKSYQVMTHFPTTVRQIFEGNFDWSDFHPWYYLPKYLAITIPIVVSAGLLVFVANTKKKYLELQKIQLWLLGFTILFPVVFVVVKNSNLYGSWRHFLFIYPGLILFAALGIQALLARYKQRGIRFTLIALFALLALHPLKFMAANHPYYYLYYNQLVGGLKGAFGNYEPDYYYTTMSEGAEWLQEYLKTKPDQQEITIGGNFPFEWYFRNNKSVRFIYFPWQKRSEYNWDYAIIANSYIPPYQLKQKLWPPQNTIHTIYADGVPVCAVIERLTKDDFDAIHEQRQGNNIKSALLFQKAVQIDPQNELICYKFAEALLATEQNELAEKELEKCLEINPDYEPALVLSGDLMLNQKEIEKAGQCYEGASLAIG